MSRDLLKSIPALTRDQMVEVDRAMVEDFGIELLQMMENAGRHLAHLARDRFLSGDAKDRTVVVLAGSGGNGGGALAAARRLSVWGARVEVFLVRARDSFREASRRQLDVLERMKLPIRDVEHPIAAGDADVVLDGMVGYGLRGRPRDEVADAVRWTRAQAVPTLSLDVPTGMDATTGEIQAPAIRATATLTLALPKTGLLVPGAEEHRGELYLGDLGVPEILYRRVGLRVGPLFAESDLLRLA